MKFSLKPKELESSELVKTGESIVFLSSYSQWFEFRKVVVPDGVVVGEISFMGQVISHGTKAEIPPFTDLRITVENRGEARVIRIVIIGMIAEAD